MNSELMVFCYKVSRYNAPILIFYVEMFILTDLTNICVLESISNLI